MHGEPTGFSTQPAALVTGKTYQIENAAMRVLDTADALDVFDNGALVDPAEYSVDWMFGRVTFDEGYTPTGPITMTGRYFPSVEIGEVTEHSLSASLTVHEVTGYGADAKVRLGGIGDVSGSFTALVLDTAVIGGVRNLAALLGAPFLLEIEYPGATMRFRAWVIAESVDVAGGVDGVIETTVNFVGASPSTPENTMDASAFGWGA